MSCDKNQDIKNKWIMKKINLILVIIIVILLIDLLIDIIKYNWLKCIGSGALLLLIITYLILDNLHKKSKNHLKSKG